MAALAFALPLALPLSSLAVTHKVVHNYKVKPPKHPHVKAEKHANPHGKAFAKSVKEHAQRSQEERKTTVNDDFGVHKEK